MSLAYSVISSEYPHLIEFTAAYLLPNVHKKHSQNHRIPNKNRESDAKQCSSYMYFWAQKAPFVYIYSIVSIVTVPASLVIFEIKNESIKSYNCSTKHVNETGLFY